MPEAPRSPIHDRRMDDLVTPRRRMRIETVLAQRTRYITVVLEDIYQPHNASAVLRSCDAFGIQDVHIIEKNTRFRTNPGVELGAAQWLTLRHWRRERHADDDATTQAAIASLRRAGYRIVATAPHRSDSTLANFDLRPGRLALLFGNEPNGLSDCALSLADEYLRIPMFGFVDSFNISVSAAIVLYQLTRELRAADIDWRLGAVEYEQLHRDWLAMRLRGRGMPI